MFLTKRKNIYKNGEFGKGRGVKLKNLLPERAAITASQLFFRKICRSFSLDHEFSVVLFLTCFGKNGYGDHRTT
jgi:hypothetical protein